TRWLKQVGDSVEVDEPLVEISTDKVDTEIPSPLAGTLLEILVDEDETVEVGAPLAKIGSPDEAGGEGQDAGQDAGQKSEAEAQPEAEQPTESAPEPAEGAESQQQPTQEPQDEPAEGADEASE